MIFKTQDDVLVWLREIGVRCAYDGLWMKYSWPAQDLYEFLKGLQQLEEEARGQERNAISYASRQGRSSVGCWTLGDPGSSFPPA